MNKAGHYEQAASDAYFYNKRNLLQLQEGLAGESQQAEREEREPVAETNKVPGA